MELNSRFSEVSTYAQSSGYNSSTASSSLSYIDDVNLKRINGEDKTKEESDQTTTAKTTLTITITLVRFEDKVLEWLIDKFSLFSPAELWKNNSKISFLNFHKAFGLNDFSSQIFLIANCWLISF